MKLCVLLNLCELPDLPCKRAWEDNSAATALESQPGCSLRALLLLCVSLHCMDTAQSLSTHQGNGNFLKWNIMQKWNMQNSHEICSEAGKKAQRVKALAAKPVAWVWSPELTWWKWRTNLHKLTNGHMSAMAQHARAHPPTHTLTPHSVTTTIMKRWLSIGWLKVQDPQGISPANVSQVSPPG